MKLYISGPITNTDPDKQAKNLAEFDKAAVVLCAAGYRVFNPAELSRSFPAASYADYMRMDIRQLLGCDGIVQLPGWSRSVGALVERDIAAVLNLDHGSLNYWLNHSFFLPLSFKAARS